jgi:non-heme chloroperoxidase
MNRIEARDGTQLYVKQLGTGRPVVLIHGWPLSADSWDPQMIALAERVPTARLIEYQGEPHAVLVTQKDRLTQDLLDFLGSTR